MKITILCGLPRSGKSTWIQNHKTDEFIMSADDLRKLVYGQVFWSNGEPLMWSIREIMLRYLMQQGVNIIVDETNTTIKRRMPIIQLAKSFGYRVECIVIDTPAYICQKRAIESNRSELIAVIDRMQTQYEAPSPDEGFDYISCTT